jgi:hypothetical protein
METNSITPNTTINGKTIAGIIILIAGSILLIDQLDLFMIPGWVLSWPMLLIAYGLYLGGKYNFRKPVWIYLTVLGSAFLLTDNITDADRFVWPLAVIGMGAWMVTRHTNRVKEGNTFTDYKQV